MVWVTATDGQSYTILGADGDPLGSTVEEFVASLDETPHTRVRARRWMRGQHTDGYKDLWLVIDAIVTIHG